MIGATLLHDRRRTVRTPGAGATARVRTGVLLVLVTGLVLSGLPRIAGAWGIEGHRMVGAIAQRYLSAESGRQVRALLRRDRLADGSLSGRTTLAEVANWADEIRDTRWGSRMSAWHFDDIPLCKPARTAQYCHRGACASAQLARHLRVLARGTASLHRQNEALKWVVHLVGDIHQPLHVATHQDRGGNEVQVSFFGKRESPSHEAFNLHGIWDTDMLRRLVEARGGESAIVDAPISRADRAAWERGSISDWVQEAHSLARTVIYSMLPAGFSCSRRPGGVLNIGRTYYSRAAPIVETQIRKAGVRLAKVLNDAFRASAAVRRRRAVRH